MKRIKYRDRISVKTREREYIGILMPRPRLTDDKHIVLKLDNGYNIGIKKSRIKNIKLIEKLQSVFF